jgi:geranylgeranyl pyrophosphate synthase
MVHRAGEVHASRPTYSRRLIAMSGQLQAFFLVLDDIMDQSFTRRGQPCWYKNADVGNIAINDATMLEAAIYQLLKSHFRGEPYYVDLLELFHEVSQIYLLAFRSVMLLPRSPN